MLGGVGFIVFSSSTAQLVEEHLDLILMFGFVVIAFQFIAELLKIRFRVNEKTVADQ